MTRERPHGPGPLRNSAGLDPVMLFIHEQMRRQRVSWWRVEARSDLGIDALRMCFYQSRNLHLCRARRVLRTLGYDLAVRPIAERDQ